MTAARETVWAALRDAALVEGPLPETAAGDTPWYVKGLLAFSGWLAALFLLLFVGAGFSAVFESAVASLVLGTAMIGAAYAVLRAPKNEFFEHVALATSLAGQALASWGLFDLTGHSEGASWLLLALMQAALAFVMPSFVHRVLSSLFAAIALSMALSEAGLPYLYNAVVLLPMAWVWLNELRYPHHLSRMHAVGYGLVLAQIALAGVVLLAGPGASWEWQEVAVRGWLQPWMGEVLAAGAALYVVAALLHRNGVALTERTGIVALSITALLCAVSTQALGLTTGVIIALLGFAAGNRVLLGLGIAALLFFVSAYYYLFDATLLVKSQSLFVSGVVALAGRWLMLRTLRPAGDSGNA